MVRPFAAPSSFRCRICFRKQLRVALCVSHLPPQCLLSQQEAKLKRLEAVKAQLEASFQSVSKAAEALDAKISNLVLTKSWDYRLQDIPQTKNGAGSSSGGSGGAASSSSRRRGDTWDAAAAALGDADASPEEMKRRCVPAAYASLMPLSPPCLPRAVCAPWLIRPLLWVARSPLIPTGQRPRT